MDELTLDFPYLEYGDYGRDPIFESLEIQAEKLILAFEAGEKMQELRMREIELQCFTESASDESFMAFVEAEDEKNAEKKDGLVKRIWDKVVELFTRIKEKFFGGSKGKDLPKNATVKVTKGYKTFFSALKSHWGSIKSKLIAKKTELMTDPKWSKVIALLTGLVAGAVTIYVGKSAISAAEEHIKDTMVANDATEALVSRRLEKNKKENTELWKANEISKEDLYEITGIQFNTDYVTLEKVAGFCQMYASDIRKKGQVGYVYGEKNGKELTKLASGMHKLLGAMHRVRMEMAFDTHSVDHY